MTYIIISLIWFILFFNFTIFFLDGYNLSNNRYISVSQKLSFLLIIILVYLIYIENLSSFNELLHMTNSKNNNTNVPQAPVITGNVGLGAAMAGVAGATASVLAKSPLPPLLKAGTVTGAGLLAGAAYTGLNFANIVATVAAANNSNRTNTTSDTANTANAASATNTANTASSTNISNTTSNLLDNSNHSDLSNLLFNIDLITSLCFTFVIFLFFLILFKFFLTEEKIQLNFSNLIGVKFNDNLNYYLIKLILTYKNISNLYIFILLILLLIGLGFNSYFLSAIRDNLDIFINLHINK
jgi:hypothetical protein